MMRIDDSPDEREREREREGGRRVQSEQQQQGSGTGVRRWRRHWAVWGVNRRLTTGEGGAEGERRAPVVLEAGCCLCGML